ncbi:MAG: hypothetical protein AAFQ84_04290, partial [Pseudomonadota bacterium]
ANNCSHGDLSVRYVTVMDRVRPKRPGGNSMLRLGVSLVFVGLSTTTSAVAERSYSPPPIGTQVTWVTDTAEGRATRVSEVVATGADFAIHLYDLTWDEEAPYNYFAEFAGFHIASCASDMPSTEERLRLQSFWPLQSGRSLSLTDQYNSTYIVGEPIPYTISQIDGTNPAQAVTAVVGDHRTDMTVSLKWHTPVQLNWGDGAGDTAIEVFSPVSTDAADALDLTALGNCAALLRETS